MSIFSIVFAKNRCCRCCGVAKVKKWRHYAICKKNFATPRKSKVLQLLPVQRVDIQRWRNDAKKRCCKGVARGVAKVLQDVKNQPRRQACNRNRAENLACSGSSASFLRQSVVRLSFCSEHPE